MKTKPLDGLRSTPLRFGQRDAPIFPRLHTRRLGDKIPDFYWIQVRKRVVYINADYFFVPKDMEGHLQKLYEQYVEWWISEKALARYLRPHVFLSRFHDFVQVKVLREHAQWWIDLLEEAAPFLCDRYDEGISQV